MEIVTNTPNSAAPRAVIYDQLVIEIGDPQLSIEEILKNFHSKGKHIAEAE